jgi:hypothetical protein
MHCRSDHSASEDEGGCSEGCCKPAARDDQHADPECGVLGAFEYGGAAAGDRAGQGTNAGNGVGVHLADQGEAARSARHDGGDQDACSSCVSHAWRACNVQGSVRAGHACTDQCLEPSI